MLQLLKLSQLIAGENTADGLERKRAPHEIGRTLLRRRWLGNRHEIVPNFNYFIFSASFNRFYRITAKIVPMRLHDADVKLFEEAAKANKLTLSEWMRLALREAAAK